MFYNYLIKAFLSDQSLFSDVKAIVDCPLKCDPAEVIQACRDQLAPSVIMQMLEEPGADLDKPVLLVTHKYGRNDFLLRLAADAPLPAERRRRRRRATIGASPELLNRLAPLRALSPAAPQVAPTRHARDRRYSLYQSEPVDMAQLFQLNSATADAIQHTGRQTLRLIEAQEQSRAAGKAEESLNTKSLELANALATAPPNQPSTLFAEELRSEHLDERVRDKMLREYYVRLQKLGVSLINTWTHFYRRVSPQWSSDRNSLIPLPRPFIVPGGRFIEIYYWDSYWIVRGLISSGFIKEAKDAIENFLYMVERIGFIPNGSRKYYQDRSQPPFLSCMLRAYYNATGDLDFISNAFPLLEKEYAFWMNERLGHAVRLELPDTYSGAPAARPTVVLNRFYSLEVTPRPESYRIDEITGKLYQQFGGAADNLQEHFRAIRAGAESGWDFSSRWIRPAIEGRGEAGIRPDQTVDQELHKLCLIDIDTCSVIPCDLNGIMYAVEQDLSYFANLLGFPTLVAQYDAAAERRQRAMLIFNWDAENERWMDYDMRRKQLSKVISAASFVPLWAGVNPERLDDTRRITLASNLSVIIRPYGIAATHVRAGLQWDSPNVWACSHHMAVDFLCGGRFWETKKDALSDDGPAMTLGINLASRFVNTVLDRFELLGTCSEKYHCYRSGKSGMDGEYVTQEGFGWTNGAVLDFLEKFGTRLCPQGLYTVSRPQEIAGVGR